MWVPGRPFIMPWNINIIVDTHSLRFCENSFAVFFVILSTYLSHVDDTFIIIVICSLHSFLAFFYTSLYNIFLCTSLLKENRLNCVYRSGHITCTYSTFVNQQQVWCTVYFFKNKNCLSKNYALWHILSLGFFNGCDGCKGHEIHAKYDWDCM